MNNFIINFFSSLFFGLIGIQSAAVLFLYVFASDYDGKSNMSPEFPFFFTTLLWLPIGSFLSILTAILNRGIRAAWWLTAFSSFLSGVLFYLCLVIVASLGVPTIFFLIPLAAFMVFPCLMRFYKR